MPKVWLENRDIIGLLKAFSLLAKRIKMKAVARIIRALLYQPVGSQSLLIFKETKYVIIAEAEEDKIYPKIKRIFCFLESSMFLKRL